MHFKWSEIMEAPLSQLIDMGKKLSLKTSDIEDRAQFTYVQVLIGYFRQDASVMKEHLKDFKSPQDDFLMILTQLRIILRSGEGTLSDLQKQLNDLILLEINPLFLGELHFLLGHLFQKAGNFTSAEKNLLLASSHFEVGGAYKKSLRSHFSSLAAYSCAHPDSRLFTEYRQLFKQALDLKDYQTAGTAMLNISREFQRLNALPMALVYIDQGLALLDQHSYGSREYSLSLCHRSHLLFQQGRAAEGQKDLFIAATNTNADVQAACDFLNEKYKVELTDLKKFSKLPNWEERAQDSNAGKLLSPLESKLLELLSEGPKTKSDLIEIIYPEQIDYEYKDGRFKNLLARLRSTYGNLILRDGNRYLISDPFSKIEKKKGSGL